MDTSSRDVSLTGHDPGPVLELVLRRTRAARERDSHRLALVVEGGAMCGIYTAASLLALHALGAARAFDDVYGTSAGAVNAAHFLSGRGEHKVDTYYRCLVDGRFIDFLRPLKAVDIDFFVDEVLTLLRPVECEAVLSSGSRLWIGVGDYATAASRIFTADGDAARLMNLLRATVAMPVVYNRLVRVGDVRGFDPGFFRPFPLHEALEHGATHVLVLLARADDHVAPTTRLWQRALFGARFARGSPALRELFADSPARSNALRDLAHGRACLPPGFEHVHVAALAPRTPRVERACQDPQLLREELVRVARGALQLLGGTPERLDAWTAAGIV